MTEDTADERLQMLADATRCMERAIELLDRAEAPGNIAAHVDLAVNQVEQFMAALRESTMRRPCDPPDEDRGSLPVR